MAAILKSGPVLKRPVPTLKAAALRTAPAPVLKRPGPVLKAPAPATAKRIVVPGKSGIRATLTKTIASGTAQPFVEPQALKSGCMYCSLAPFHHDFADFKDSYMRDANKILAKERDGHLIRHRNVAERPWIEVDILFVGEAPGGDEDRDGSPFVGRSGKLLRNTIAEVLPGASYACTNLIRCRPPRNKDPTKTEIASCSPELVREIQLRKPKLIVVLGNKSMEWLTGQSGITTLTGRFLETIRPEFPTIPVLGCLHPAYVLRMDFELEKFVTAIALAGKFIAGEHTMLPGIGTYSTLTELDEVRDMVARFKAEGRKIAFDTETGALTPFQDKFPRLLCFSFSNLAGTGYTVPFDHIESPWRVGGEKESEREELKDILRDLITFPCRRTGQNEKFDRQHIKYALDIDLPITDSDTMNRHLVINEKRGSHGLDLLAYEFTGMGGYDRFLDEYKAKHRDADPQADVPGSYANIPGEILFRYAAADADCTLRVDDAIEQHEAYVSNPKFRALAESFFPHLSACLADMEFTGAQIDPAVVTQLDIELVEQMRVATEKIRAFPEVQQFEADQRVYKGDPEFEFNPGSPTQLRKVLFDYYHLEPVEMTDTGFDRIAARYKSRVASAKEAGNPEPRFSELVQEAIQKREWDLFTTKADTLHEYERAKNPLAAILLEYREAETLHGTFVMPLKEKLDADNRIHGSFWIGGTVTGRLSSSNPNLQNIPNKGDGKIKRAYISRFGEEGVLLNVDFSQIELRIAAAYFKEPRMRDVYINKQDLHLLTASVIAGMTLEAFKKQPKSVQKKWRTRAKRVNFGVLYGGGPPALQATLRKDGVFITLEECKKFIDAFFKAYPRLRRGMDALTDSVKKSGYLESFTGRWRRVPEAFASDNEMVARAIRQAINFPIQSGAGDMTLMALVLINRVLKSEGYRSKCILTVHDSIVFDCHISEVIAVSKIAKSIMETIPQLSEQILPGLDWKWLDVPIVAECELGRNWGQMVEFEPDELEAGILPKGKPLFGPDEDKPDKIVQRRKPASWDEMVECLDRKAA